MKPSGLHLSATLAVTTWLASVLPAAQQQNLLVSFHSNAWLNLHHYVRAVARGGPPQTGLSEEEQEQWTAGVEFYKPYVPRDLLLDDGMVAINRAQTRSSTTTCVAPAAATRLPSTGRPV